MKNDSLQNQLRLLARAVFVSSFALLTAVACGEGFVPQTLGGSRIVPGQVGALSSVRITKTTVSPMGDAHNNYFWMKFTISDNAQVVELEAFPNGNVSMSGGQVSDTGSQTVGTRTYSIQAACVDYTCAQYAAILHVQDSTGGSTYKEAILVDSDGDRSVIVARLPNANSASVNSVIPALQSELANGSYQ